MDIGSNFEWTRVNWTRNPFPKMESKDFERPRWSFGFEIESNMDLSERGCFLLALLNLEQYIITKTNAWWHECNNQLYRA
jgi:hypothetical protein